MRIYISADMEGVTGLVDAHDVQPGGRDYERGRVMMTEDVNAAVRGALAGASAEITPGKPAGQVTQVTVNDAHGPMRNLLPDLLHPAAELIRGRPKPMGMLEGLSGDFDATVCIGYHARAGALGVLSHSFMGHEIEDMWLDDRPAGEIGLVHATAAALGAPVIALSGDDAACAEMTGWDPAVATVAVKRARDRFAAELRPAMQARAATTMFTQWPDITDDPEVDAAAGLLTSVIAESYFDQTMRWIEARADEPAEWRQAAQFGDTSLYVTAAELAELGDQVTALVDKYLDRQLDPRLRPPGSRPVAYLRLAFPRMDAAGRLAAKDYAAVQAAAGRDDRDAAGRDDGEVAADSEPDTP